MKRFAAISATLFVLLLGSAYPTHLVLADCPSVCTNGCEADGVTCASAPTASSTSSAQTSALYNPLPSTDLRVIIGTLIRALLGLSGALALVMFIYGGFLWMTSFGEPAKVEKGKKTLIWAIFGLVVLFTAYSVVSLIISTLTTAAA